MLRKIKVLVVDDSPYSRQTIRGMLESDDAIEVCGFASNGVEAMARVFKLMPDVITLDFEMPEMDGFTFLRWLMAQRPLPVIMVTAYSDSQTLFKALELGAVDFIAKPSHTASAELALIQGDLLKKVRGVMDLQMEKVAIAKELLSEIPGDQEVIKDFEDPGDRASSEDRVVAIGSSTGGPTALQVVLSRLPSSFPAPVLISQHMPKGFTQPFAERLSRLVKLTVREAAEGDPVRAGTVLICPGGKHMIVEKKKDSFGVALRNSTESDRYIPSVDIMMESVADHFGPSAVGVILTGMGNDGSRGIVEIKKKGGYTIAEDSTTAVIFGMPNEAIKTGAVDKVEPLSRIPKELIRIVEEKKQKQWKKR